MLGNYTMVKKIMGIKLSALDNEMPRNQTAVGKMDDSGSVKIFGKRLLHSQSDRGFNIRYFVGKVTRCTTDGAVGADAISNQTGAG